MPADGAPICRSGDRLHREQADPWAGQGQALCSMSGTVDRNKKAGALPRLEKLYIKSLSPLLRRRRGLGQERSLELVVQAGAGEVAGRAPTVSDLAKRRSIAAETGNQSGRAI